MEYFDYNKLIAAITGYTEKIITYIDKTLSPQIEICGYSELGRPIIAISDTSPTILLQGAMHAREHLTAKLLCDLAINYFDKNIKNSETGLCFVPIANPDGVEISINGLQNADILSAQIERMTNAVNSYNEIKKPTLKKYRNKKIKIHKLQKVLDEKYAIILKTSAGLPLKIWKANANCVDLNLNFDADWGLGIGNRKSLAYKGYIGKSPLSEKETQSLVALTEKYQFEYTLSYHARGDVIYYGWKGKDPSPAFRKEISRILGYTMHTTPTSAGGYKDYFVSKYEKAGLTIEIGSESNLSDLEMPTQYEELYHEYPDIFIRHMSVIYFLIRR